MCRIKSSDRPESVAALLGFQEYFAASRHGIMTVALAINQSARGMACSPSPFCLIVLLQALDRILADTDVEAVAAVAPQHVSEIRFPRDSGHVRLEFWLRGVDLNRRSRACGIMGFANRSCWFKLVHPLPYFSTTCSIMIGFQSFSYLLFLLASGTTLGTNHSALTLRSAREMVGHFRYTMIYY